jgi:hypothetical protein
LTRYFFSAETNNEPGVIRPGAVNDLLPSANDGCRGLIFEIPAEVEMFSLGVV